METALYKGMRYDTEYGLLLVVQVDQEQLITVPFPTGTLEVDKRIKELGGNLVLIQAGLQDEGDDLAILVALLELTKAVGGIIYK